MVFVTLKSLQLFLDIFGLEQFYPLDEVTLFYAIFTRLIPVTEDFFQIPDLQLLQVNRLNIDALLCKMTKKNPLLK